MCLVEGAVCEEIGIRLIEGRPVVDGIFVNEHGPYRFLVDTGASMNHLEPEVARKAGFPTTFRTELTSSIGTVEVPGSGRLTVTLGGLHAKEQPFLFAGTEALQGLGAGIQGVLGQAFLGRFDYTIDLQRRRLTFGRREASGKKSPFLMLRGRTLVPTSLGDLILDSGAAQLVLFGRMGVGEGQNYLRTLTGTGTVGMLPSLLSIDGRRVWAGQALTLAKQAEPGVAGLLPIRLFRTIYVCNSENYLVFQ